MTANSTNVGYNTLSIMFTARTSSARVQQVRSVIYNVLIYQIIEDKLEQKKPSVLGAPVGKKVVIYIDDVNMPKQDEYGAQPPIELLRQYLDYGGFYDRKELFWKEIQV